MGGAQSKSDDPQPPPTVRQGLFKSEALRPAARQPPLLREPWREINWQENENSLQYVKDYKPLIEGQQLRILLHGPVGAGKSSFINSVQTVLRGRMYTQALVDNISHGCFTKMYTTYKIQKPGKGSLYPFVFNDIMGLDANKGVLVDDIKLALKGHVKEGYRFNPESRLSEDNHFYNNCPTDNDRVHILVCVVPANTGSILRDEIVNKIRQIRMEATELRIPQVVILTKIDEACPEIKQDLKNVYKVQYVKEKMEQFSADVGVPMNCIFPLKNYNSEINLKSDIDSLILSTLINIINFGDDCINFHKNQSEVLDTPWREINWSKDKSDQQFVNNYKPKTQGQQLRILLHGAVGAGKSGFINSVRSVLLGKMSSRAYVDNISHCSATKKYSTFKIPKGSSDTVYPFVLNDMMGLNPSNRRQRKVYVKDLKRVMKGNVKDGYTFNPESKISKDDRYYIRTPSANDKVHVLVYVIDSNKKDLMTEGVLETMLDIREEASDLGIPQVAILTKIDEACPEIGKDVKNVYKSKKLKEKMEKFSAEVGIPMNCIFPVKNYHEETDLNSDIDALILNTLRHIINAAEDITR